MLLQRFAHHLRGQLRLHVLQAIDRIVPVFELRFVLVLQRRLRQLLLKLHLLQSVLQLIAFLLHRVHRLGDREGLLHLDRVELRLQFLDLRLLRRCRFLQFVQQLLLGQLGFGLVGLSHLLQLVREAIALLLHSAQSLLQRQLLGRLGSVQAGLQTLDLGVLLRRFLLQLSGDLRFCKLDGRSLLLLGDLQSLMDRLLELVVAHLFQDVRVTRFIDLEGFAAMGADDLVHGILLRIES